MAAILLRLALCACAFASFSASATDYKAAQQTVVIYGATGGGFGAAISAAREQAESGHVVLISLSSHVGGMVTGGLQHTDSANATIIGGITREFFERVERQYPGRPVDPDYPKDRSGPPGWLFESHVAEDVMRAMLKESNVTLILNGGGIAGVQRTASQIKSIALTGSGTQAAFNVSGDVFIDASYEGDLLAAAGATMTWSRESAAQYGEINGGRRSITPTDNFNSVHINPFWDPSAEHPIALPHVTTTYPGEVGDGDDRVTAYDYRLCMNNSPGNRLLVTEPPGYNASEFELWRRLYAATKPTSLAAAGLNCLGPIPNTYSDCTDDHGHSTPCKKCDMIGGGPLSTDFIAGSYGYPNATNEERRAIVAAHIQYTRSLLWFLANDTAVPAGVRQQLTEFGHCTDEYLDTQPPHWPHQLYVREARRLVGDWVFTSRQPDAAHLGRSIGMGSYVFDCHQVQRPIHFTSEPSSPAAAWVVNEGEVEKQYNGSGGSVMQEPYVIPFDTLLPRRAELTNALAAVPVSASHVRFSSLRMEPTWMVMGQAAGTAAAQALATALSVQGRAAAVVVQDVDIDKLQASLRAAGQILYD